MSREFAHRSSPSTIRGFCQNSYWQYFCGYDTLTWEAPCHPSELGKFRKRIGPDGVDAILGWTIQHRKDHGSVQSQLVVINSTVQEKYVTTPRDHKLYRKIAEIVLSLAATAHLPPSIFPCCRSSVRPASPFPPDSW